LTELVAETSSKINQFRDILRHLLGQQRYDARIEEIEAFVKSSVDAVLQELETSVHDTNALVTLPSTHSPVADPTPSPATTSAVNLSSSGSNIANTNVQITRERFQLERVSSFTGLPPNYLLYELSLDSKYALPLAHIHEKIQNIQHQQNFLTVFPPPLRVNSEELKDALQKNPLAAAGILKDQMLRIMGDRLIGAMSLSLLTDCSEVLCFIWF
jgi:hypothetical protein